MQHSASFWYFSLRILEKKLLHSPKHRWWISILLLLLVYVFSPSFPVFVSFGKALEGWCEADCVVGGCVRLCSRVAWIIVQGKILNCHPTADDWIVKDTTQAVRGWRKITSNINIHPKYSILYLHIFRSAFLFQFLSIFHSCHDLGIFHDSMLLYKFWFRWLQIYTYPVVKNVA